MEPRLDTKPPPKHCPRPDEERMKVLELSSGSVATFRQNAVHFPS